MSFLDLLNAILTIAAALWLWLMWEKIKWLERMNAAMAKRQDVQDNIIMEQSRLLRNITELTRTSFATVFEEIQKMESGE